MNLKAKITELEADEEKFLQELDDLYPPYKIGELTFYPSQILKECDPVALRCALADEPIKYQCDDCQEIFEDESEAIEHWNDSHKTEENV